ncbi:hypothetical protein AXA44_25310 [Rhodococcus sp. SC4]|nr:hypothetical protein AXA44_25310 [Rhodococcus sp. SC4]
MNLDVMWMSMVYGTLLRQSEDGTLEPWMAESAEVLDPRRVRTTLRRGVMFANGSLDWAWIDLCRKNASTTRDVLPRR